MGAALDSGLSRGVGTCRSSMVSAAFGALERRAGGGPLMGGWHADDRGTRLPPLRQAGGRIRVSIERPRPPMLGGLGEVTPTSTPAGRLAQLATRDPWPHQYRWSRPAAVSASRSSATEMLRWGATHRDDGAHRRRDPTAADASLRPHPLSAWDPNWRWNAAGISVEGLRLFDAAEAAAAAGPGATEAPKDRVWLVRLGQWSQWWLNTQGKVWTGPLPRPLIELDHRKNRGIEVLAKRVALNALPLWCAIRSRAPLERRIETCRGIGDCRRGGRTAHWAGGCAIASTSSDASQGAGLIEDVVWPERSGRGHATATRAGSRRGWPRRSFWCARPAISAPSTRKAATARRAAAAPWCGPGRLPIRPHRTDFARSVSATGCRRRRWPAPSASRRRTSRRWRPAALPPANG